MKSPWHHHEITTESPSNHPEITMKSPMKSPLNPGFPMVFLWFSYGFPIVFLWFSYDPPLRMDHLLPSPGWVLSHLHRLTPPGLLRSWRSGRRTSCSETKWTAQSTWQGSWKMRNKLRRPRKVLDLLEFNNLSEDYIYNFASGNLT